MERVKLVMLHLKGRMLKAEVRKLDTLSKII